MQSEKGQSIEDASMQIIENEVRSHPYNEFEWPIVRRVIHATADFDFARKNKIVFHKDAIQSGINALKRGCNIVVDVDAVIGGFNKKNLESFGNKVVCKISDLEVVKVAKQQGKTRAQISMRMSSNEMNGSIIVIGNAPTALLEVIQMIKEETVRPALIIGIPVGFVSAPESKEELKKIDLPYITNLGRKGGSPAASSIVNAIFKLIP